jgi:protein-disulfide isomerase
MKDQWTSAAAGGLGGAVLALAVVFGASYYGLLPGSSDKAMHDYLMSHPEILVDMTNKLQESQDTSEDTARQAAVDKLGKKAFFDPRLAFITGPANAKTTVVEFFDYNCPHCRKSLPTVMKFYNAHKDARFAFIEFPIEGPQSVVAARAAMAARKQPDKYVAFHFALMGEQGVVDEDTVYADAQKTGLDVARLKTDMKSSQIDLALAESHTLAQAAKIDGTPAFIIDGKMHEGELYDDDIRKLTKG